MTLEKDVDQGIVQWAKAQWPGMIVRKLTAYGGMGVAGDPDRLFFYKGKLMLIEMKRPGGECTDIQIMRQNEWRAAGARVIVTDNVSAGRSALNVFFNGRNRRYTVMAPQRF